MPRLAGVRQRQHQPIYDSLVRDTGPLATPINATSRLFGTANVGDLGRTNLEVAGQLASDQTYVVLSLRAWLFFDGTNARANYNGVTSQLTWTFVLGDRPQFEAPSWYFPAGGGVWGAGDPTLFNNGLPGQSEILKLARQWAPSLSN
jgi:hypothetical protein